ncbi:glucose 1-dehydrogenase, partial [bacterium]|nr:glucose 1-dehydrogenase [bacterium]
EEGAKLVVADINGEAAKMVAGEMGDSAIAVVADVSKNSDVEAMIQQTVAQWGRLDILVNNAGTTHRNKPMTEVTEEEFDRIFAVNVKSVFLTARHGVPLMKEQGHGMILNVASTAGLRPRPGLAWYNTSKGAMITATKAMAIELASFKIRVNAINPVAGETGMLHLFMGEDTPEKRAQFVSSIPWGRLSQPQDMANAALFLCSDEADMVTGTCMEVDGGRCI